MMNNSEQMDIKKYWQIILGRKYTFIAVSLICMSIIVWGSYFVPEIYEAKSTVFIERNIINSLVKNIAVTPSLEDRLGVMSYAMMSRNLLLKVINELDIEVNMSNVAEIERLIKNLQEHTDIQMVSKKGKTTDLFTVAFRNKDPKFARDFVNTLVSRYIEENLSAKRDESYEANKFRSEQIQYFRKKLNKSDEKVTNFRKEKGIFVAIDENQIVQEIKEAQENLEELNVQKMELRAKRKMTQEQIKQEKPYTVAMLGKMTGDSLDNKILLLQNKLNELLIKYTENYPEVIKVRSEIETLKMQLKRRPAGADDVQVQVPETEMSTLNPLYQQLKEELAKTDLEIAALAAKEEHLKGLIESKKEYLKNIPIEKKKLADLERERNTFRKIDEELVIKLGQTEVSKQMEVQDKTETFRIVDPAILPTKPVSPNRVMIMLLGLVAGLAGGFGTVFLLDNMDNSVKSVDTLKSFVNVPILAVIPSIITEEDISKRRKVDRTVYGISITYLSVIGVLFIKEVIEKFL